MEFPHKLGSVGGANRGENTRNASREREQAHANAEGIIAPKG